MSFGAFLSTPTARGRRLVHVVDLDDGTEARLPALPHSRPAAPRDARVYLARGGRRGDEVRPLRGTSTRAGTYRGLWWVRP
jgi:hypothetical protein